MKTSSAKNKGRRLQIEIRDLILENFNELEPDDVRSTPMGVPGPDLLTSPKCQSIFQYQPEMKNQEKINIWESLKQAEDNATEKLKAVLFFKRNRSKTYAVIEAKEFIRLLKELHELKNK